MVYPYSSYNDEYYWIPVPSTAIWDFLKMNKLFVHKATIILIDFISIYFGGTSVPVVGDKKR